ncbi:hypothetical protein GCM10009819_20580 [Agromyces tropicus]|uniref:ScoMcrA-like SRA domain-containing protein n=1 Tax=Agromyces tropicus TaxID=555371 RepID=A0ABP5FXF8_9MICO
MTRSDLAVEYGGSTQGGIVASRQSNMVFLFTDPGHGSQFGYVYDGFDDDGSAYYYTGAGQNGDQVLTHSNAPIARAAERGSAIHLFAADGFVAGTGTRRQRYIGEFIVDPNEPVQRMPALSTDGVKLRTVLVFRLLPSTEVSPQLVDAAGRSQIPREPFAVEVPTEINSAEFFETAGTADQVAVRRESDLVASFLSSNPDRDFSRWAINLPAEHTRLLTDVYDERERVLYEAKAIAGRSDLRMAVGQLYDYRRHIDVAELRCSVLLPTRPSADLRDLLADAGLGLVFREQDQFNFELAGTPRTHATAPRS